MVRVDEPELAGQLLKRERNRLVPHELHRVEDAAVQHHRRSRTTVVLEEDPRSITRVGVVRHAKSLMRLLERRLAGTFRRSVRPRAQQQTAESGGERREDRADEEREVVAACKR